LRKITTILKNKCGKMFVILLLIASILHAKPLIEMKTIKPVCDPGDDQLILEKTLSFTLDASRSYNYVKCPSKLSFLWDIFSTPYDPLQPPITLVKDSPKYAINSSKLIPGLYRFILWIGCNGMDIVACISNVTIVKVE